MSTVLQLLFSGMANGCVYGLVALGFVLIYKATGVMSFMQGDLLMLGGFCALALNLVLGWPWALAGLCAVLVMALGGALIERGLLRASLGQGHLSAVLLTFGIGLALRGAVSLVPEAANAAHLLALPFAGQVWRLGELVLSAEHLMVILVTALLALGLHLFFRRTRAGRALRASAEDPRMATLMGVSVAQMHTLAWALGAALAAAAGLLLAPLTFVHLGMGAIALKAFPAAVLGGLTSLPGALLGGLFLGISEALAGAFLPEGGKALVPHVLLLLVLLCFPAGLAAGWRGRV